MKKNKGITLIALVITIIVMLILVAVTINMAINGGLFNYAGKAAKDTENARDNELEIANGKVEIGGKPYNSIDEYIESMKDNVNLIEFTVNGETYHAEEGMTWLDYFKSEYVKELLPNFNGALNYGMNIDTAKATDQIFMNSAMVGLSKEVSCLVKTDTNYIGSTEIPQTDIYVFGDKIAQGGSYYLWSGYIVA